MNKIYKICGIPNHAKEVRQAMGQNHPAVELAKIIAPVLLLPMWFVLMYTLIIMLGA